MLDALPKYLKSGNAGQKKIIAYPNILGVAGIETVNSLLIKPLKNLFGQHQ